MKKETSINSIHSPIKATGGLHSNQGTADKLQSFQHHQSNTPLGFEEAIEFLVNRGIEHVDDISTTAAKLLTAAYIRDSDTITKWEFITEPDGCSQLPTLLIKLLEVDDSQPLDFYHPAQSISIVIAQSAMEWAMGLIESAIEKAVSKRRAEENIENKSVNNELEE